MSFTNGHPTRKFRNIQPVKVDGDTDMYNFEKCCVKLPKSANSYKSLYDITEEQVKKMRADGLTEKQLCEANINKTRRIKMKIQMLQLAPTGTGKQLCEANIEFSHGVIICAYLGACVWGEDFGISLADGTIPSVPEDEIGSVCRQIVEVAKKISAEKSAPKKFTDNFTPETIKQGEEWFIDYMGQSDTQECSTATIERYYEIFYDCKKWATGEMSIDKNVTFTWDAKTTTKEQVEERLEEFYLKVQLFMFMMSIYNKGNGKTPKGEIDFKHFKDQVEKNGFQFIRQRHLDDKDFIGYIGVYSNEEWNALVAGLPTAKFMVKDEKQPKREKLCACGCRTFKKKLMKAECCGVRYVDAEHQKKDWAEHKKVCKNYKKKEVKKAVFKMPTCLEEELAMWVCPMSCEGCEFCNYKPQFVSVEVV